MHREITKHKPELIKIGRESLPIFLASWSIFVRLQQTSSCGFPHQWRLFEREHDKLLVCFCGFTGIQVEILSCPALFGVLE